ncbi:hypothetical protein GQX73_g6086 [Xylaria multiplex]|uniref:Oxidase ustYa n=1 Tax=Xylaria multiplex TaxID=323545 RepID=A0A7C8IQW3_9PEZI|nr:hypothetical protein GQX73_g6086 [Xylaria multiplex]
MDPRRPQYQTVPAADDHEKLLSTVRVPESIVDEWQTSDPRLDSATKRHTFISRVKHYIWFVDTVLLLVVASLLFVLIRDGRRDAQHSSWQIGGDSSGTGPEFSTQVVKWEADAAFVPENTTEFFSEDTLDQWKTLMPADGQRMKAGTGFGAKGESFSTTSMTHQLHCLFMMGRIYAGVTAGTTDSLPTDYHAHFLHCIDYLRQAVMCSADIALELHDSSDADDLGPQDGGWNGHHVCKDYTQVLGYLEDQIAEGVRIILPIDD